MSECARWLTTLVPEVPVRHIPAGDPYWRPVMTAGEVIDRIKKNLGAPWRDTTYRDTFKFGGPETVVTGIATTAFVTLEVIERAAAAGLNMIIPHEATFWNDRDDIAMVSGDPLYAAKVELMKKHDIVVFRIHDHMHVAAAGLHLRGIGARRRPRQPLRDRARLASLRHPGDDARGAGGGRRSGAPARARCASSAIRTRR